MQKRILLVGNDSSVKAALHQEFADKDCLMATCESSEVEDRFKTFQPHVIILDTGKDSPQISRIFGKYSREYNFSIILLAESMDRRLLSQAHKAGVNYYILKQDGYTMLRLTLQTIFNLENTMPLAI